LDNQEEIDHDMQKAFPQSSGFLTRKKTQHQSKEKANGKEIPLNKVSRNLVKEKREETTNKEKIMGIQTTIEISLGVGSVDNCFGHQILAGKALPRSPLNQIVCVNYVTSCSGALRKLIL
jgi:hypothetical protein